ncbi:hypothetical protein KI387_010688, partial [Taxus chinensis]
YWVGGCSVGGDLGGIAGEARLVRGFELWLWLSVVWWVEVGLGSSGWAAMEAIAVG